MPTELELSHPDFSAGLWAESEQKVNYLFAQPTGFESAGLRYRLS